MPTKECVSFREFLPIERLPPLPGEDTATSTMLPMARHYDTQC